MVERGERSTPGPGQIKSKRAVGDVTFRTVDTVFSSIPVTTAGAPLLFEVTAPAAPQRKSSQVWRSPATAKHPGITILYMVRRIALLIVAACLHSAAQQAEVIYDEAKVPKFTLPDVLALRGGERVRDAQSWSSRRRPEILALYETEVFGKSPARPARLNYEVKAVEKGALGGKADRKVVTVYFGEARGGPKMDLLIYLPAGARKAVPVFLGLSFSSIHTVANDAGIPLGQRWVRGVQEASPESSRGSAAPQWQVEKILAAGYGLATVDYNDIEPDFVGAMAHGVDRKRTRLNSS